MTEETPEIAPTSPETSGGSDVPPNHLSVNPRSPFFDAEKLQRGVGIRFKDRVRTDIERDLGTQSQIVLVRLNPVPGEGTFVLPPAAAEFMYVGDSLGYSSTGSVTVK